MTRARRRLGTLLLASLAVAAAASAYAGCTSSAPPSTSASDGGLDGSTPLLSDGAPAPADVIFLPSSSDAAPGSACTSLADCPVGLLCLYPVSEGCSARGVCSLFDGSCGGPYCSCTGDTTGVCSGLGYAPIASPLHGPPCGGGPDDSGASDAAGAHD